jgi:hypothetical protein
MYYRWKDGRIIVKTTLWGAMEGDARQTLQHLAADVRSRTSGGETSQPETDGSVGITRNGPVQQVDEPDRKFSLFFCHLPGVRGEFRDHPVDYKCVAPHAPVQGNRAFDTALESTDGILMVVRPDDEGLDQARHAADDLVDRLGERHTLADASADRADDLAALFGPDGPLSLVVLMLGADASAAASSVRESLGLPASVELVAQDPAEPLDSASRAFEALVDGLVPHIKRAAERGRLPV